MNENLEQIIDLGWDITNHRLKISFIKENNTVRLNKIGDNNHNFPGPELAISKIPELIDALEKIYSEQNKD
jgi:hypothetical protein